MGVVRTVLPDVAEGVYAASGNPDPKISDLIVVNNWGEGGVVKCIVNFSEFDNLSNLTLFLEFNAEVSDVSSNGGTQSVSGNTAQINWYTAPASAEVNYSRRCQEPFRKVWSLLKKDERAYRKAYPDTAGSPVFPQESRWRPAS